MSLRADLLAGRRAVGDRACWVSSWKDGTGASIELQSGSLSVNLLLERKQWRAFLLTLRRGGVIAGYAFSAGKPIVPEMRGGKPRRVSLEYKGVWLFIESRHFQRMKSACLKFSGIMERA